MVWYSDKIGVLVVHLSGIVQPREKLSKPHRFPRMGVGNGRRDDAVVGYYLVSSASLRSCVLSHERSSSLWPSIGDGDSFLGHSRHE